MKKNMGIADRIVRIITAVILGVLVFNGTITGALAWVLGVLALVLLLTSFVSFCPLYAPFSITTQKSTEKTA